MSGLRIGIDVDGVVADNHTAWLARFNRERSTRWTPADLTQWEIWKDLGVESDQIFKHYTPDIYNEVRPFDGAAEAVNTIVRQGHIVTFVTSCKGVEEYNAKRAWLKHWGFFSAGNIATIPVGMADEFHHRDKSDVPVDWLIDDHIAHCESFNGYALLVTRPHNRNLSSHIKRVKSLADVIVLLEHTPEGGKLPYGFTHELKEEAVAEIEATRIMSCNAGAGIPLSAFDVDIDMNAAYAKALRTSLPTGRQERKDTPVTTGVLDYFAAAIAEVARVSMAGNRQHDLGPLHWARGISADHADSAVRHIMERGLIDVDGERHSAKAAWRALALLQEELEAAGAPMSRASRAVAQADGAGV